MPPDMSWRELAVDGSLLVHLQPGDIDEAAARAVPAAPAPRAGKAAAKKPAAPAMASVHRKLIGGKRPHSAVVPSTSTHRKFTRLPSAPAAAGSAAWRAAVMDETKISGYGRL